MIYTKDLITAEIRLKPKSCVINSVLGDGYLFEKNKTYRTRRQTAVDLKIKFKKANKFYNLSPLLCLPSILIQKTVPYFENKKIIADFNSNSIKITADELLFLGTKTNHILHETSHVIMWLAAQKNLDFKKQNEIIIAFLLSESYANYSETIANVFASTEKHKDFLKLNSFWTYSESEVETLAQLRKKYNTYIVNTALFLCFLYSNFLYKKIGSRECKNINLFISSQNSKISLLDLQDIFAISSQLNIHFLIETGKIFWRTLGFKTDFFQSLDFDPVEFLLQNKDLRINILRLIDQDC
jgi:hypothetical protein